MKRILSFIRRAVSDYHMIEEGDKIAVGVSGGKDSVTLLYALGLLRRFYPKKFDLVGITLNMGFPGFDASKTASFLEGQDIPYYVFDTQIKEIVFDIRKEKNPCALCANLRRGALNRNAKELNCNKVALGHHYDDVIETFYLSLLYEGKIDCFSPVTYLDRMDITKIRPMIYVPESFIKNAVNRYHLPIIHNPCPANGKTKRQEMKELIARLDKDIRSSKKRVFTALCRSDIDGWKIKDGKL